MEMDAMEYLASRYPIRLAGFVLVVWLTVFSGVTMAAPAEGMKVAFLAAESTVDELGPEAQAARKLAERLCKARLLLVSPDGEFVDEGGNRAELDRFDVL